MTIWYDFTTTLLNSGRSGIAASEWSIGQAMLDAAPGARSFVLDERRGLVEIDARVDLANAVYAGSEAGTSMAAVALPAWRQIARRSAIALGPRWAPVIAVVSKGVRAAHRKRRELQSRVRRGAPAVHRTALIDVVQPDDFVVSMGAVWDGSLIERLDDLRRRTGCGMVTMVYDLIPLTHTHLAFHKQPELFVRYYERLVAASDLIVCISEQSKRDLQQFGRQHGLEMPTVEVLILGEAPPSAELDPVQERDDFFLCVGTVERRKNLELVYDALRILESEGFEVPKVVVAGAVGWGVDDFLREVEQRTTTASRSMMFVGSVDDVALDRLYRRARALLFPSQYEGWGLPVREAAIRGCPVAVGDSPAVREAIAGYRGATVLPVDDPAPWADYLLATPSEVHPAAPRRWSETAERLLQLLSEHAHVDRGCDGGRR